MRDTGTDAVPVLVRQLVGRNNQRSGLDRRFAKRLGGAAVTLIFAGRWGRCTGDKEIHQPG